MSQAGPDVWGAAIRRHQSEVAQLVGTGRLFDAARFDSPEAIGRAYAAGLDALEPAIGHEPDFPSQAQTLLNYINGWIGDVDELYSDYLSVSRNVAGIDHNDLMSALDIAINGITAAGVLVELAKITATGLMSQDIQKAARYRAAVMEFQDRVEGYFAMNIVGRRGGW